MSWLLLSQFSSSRRDRTSKAKTHVLWRTFGLTIFV